MQSLSAPKTSTELSGLIGECRNYLLYAALFSLGMNLLYLSAPIYSLQVYDRVLSSLSVPTLVTLTLALVVALATLAALDYLRSRILVRAGIRIDNKLSERVFDSLVAQSLREPGASRQQALRDLDVFRQFSTGPGANAVFDAPWIPVYVIISFLIHPLVGTVSLLCAVFIFGLAVLNEKSTRKSLFAASESAAKGYQFAEITLRNGEVIRAMGLQDRLRERWKQTRDEMLGAQIVGSDRAGATMSAIKFARMVSQSILLGVAAWLVIERLVTPGAMFASVIILGRLMQPVEHAVSSWGQFGEARRAFARLSRLLDSYPAHSKRLELPAPLGKLSVEALEFSRRGSDTPVLKGISFELAPGESRAVIGPTAAGKSTLARLMVGVLAPISGAVRLDGAKLSDWNPVAVGHFIGYVPQDVELLAGTVAENIARFEEASAEDIVAAARFAGIHDMVLRLPAAYETPVGEGGMLLSGGQRQRVALARAVFGEPRLVVLDEPNSNLDAEGEAALIRCMRGLKERGITVLVVTHRLGLLRGADKAIMLANGRMEAYGPCHEVLQKLNAMAQRRSPGPQPLRTAP
jgi:ATP-binding cassette subfamily C protein